MGRPTTAYINKQALIHNLERVQHYAPHSKVMVMVKANGYGHGYKLVATTLSHANAFGVASIEEALQLRELGITQEIVLMQGFFSAYELDQICQQRLSIVVHNLFQLQALTDHRLSEPIKIWLKVNSGMNRLGIAPEQVNFFWQRLMASSNIQKPIILMTHFASADEAGKEHALQQFETFKQATEGYDTPRSLANSAAILSLPDTHGAWVRPGIMLYGGSPFVDHVGADHGLQPVMTLASELIAVKQAQKGSSVGYGATYTCPESMPIGTVTIGYGDGYPRHATTGTPVLINNTIVPLVGRVSMDMIAVDLRLCPQAKIGDRVVLWGEGLPVELVAKHAGTICYELLCHITRRVKYEVI